MATEKGEITRLLQRWRVGDRDAESKIFELLLPELRKIAACYFRRERPGHTLQPTALVNEAFLRLSATKDIDWQDRGHFLVVSARIMRRYLIDHARHKRNVQFLPMEGLPEHVLGTHTKLELAVAVDALLEQLSKESPRRATMVELKFFLGTTDSEAAEALNLRLRTVQREWHDARWWLLEKLSKEPWRVPDKIA